MKLDVIGEIHPINIIQELFSQSHLGTQADSKILSYFSSGSGLSPSFIVNDNFWNQLYTYVRSVSGRKQKSERKLIFIGDLHARGKFGLPMQFRDRGIGARVIRSFVDYEGQIERNFEQMQEIKSKNFPQRLRLEA